MTLSALQGRTLTRLVEDVRTLLVQGEAPSSSLRALDAVRRTGLWSEHGEVAVASPAVVILIDRLPNPGEALPAVLSLVPEVREAWLRVVRARLFEMGERGDVAALTEAITHAGALASQLVGVQTPSLAATPCGELERAVLTTPAHEAAAFPVLLRVLAATAAAWKFRERVAVLEACVAGVLATAADYARGYEADAGNPALHPETAEELRRVSKRFVKLGEDTRVASRGTGGT